MRNVRIISKPNYVFVDGTATLISKCTDEEIRAAAKELGEELILKKNFMAK